MNKRQLLAELRRTLGQINGSIKSKKKTLAARKNGKKGGRPRTRR